MTAAEAYRDAASIVVDKAVQKNCSCGSCEDVRGAVKVLLEKAKENE